MALVRKAAIAVEVTATIIAPSALAPDMPPHCSLVSEPASESFSHVSLLPAAVASASPAAVVYSLADFYAVPAFLHWLLEAILYYVVSRSSLTVLPVDRFVHSAGSGVLWRDVVRHLA